MIATDIIVFMDNLKQKFIIKPNGEIVVDWVIPEFSDVIIELMPEERRKMYIEEGKRTGQGPRIYCG